MFGQIGFLSKSTKLLHSVNGKLLRINVIYIVLLHKMQVAPNLNILEFLLNYVQSGTRFDVHSLMCVNKKYQN